MLRVLLTALFLIGCAEIPKPIALFTDARVLHGAWRLTLQQRCNIFYPQLEWQPNNNRVAAVLETEFAPNSSTDSVVLLDTISQQKRFVASGFIWSVQWKKDGSALAVWFIEDAKQKLVFYDALSLEVLGVVLLENPSVLLSSDFRFLISRNTTTGAWQVQRLENYNLTLQYELPLDNSFVYQISADGQTALVLTRAEKWVLSWLDLASGRILKTQALDSDLRIIPDPALESFLLLDFDGQLQLLSKTGELTVVAQNVLDARWSADGSRAVILRRFENSTSVQVFALPNKVLEWQALFGQRFFRIFALRPDNLAILSDGTSNNAENCDLTLFEKTNTDVLETALNQQSLTRQVFELELRAQLEPEQKSYSFLGKAIRTSDQSEFSVRGFGHGAPDTLFTAKESAPLEVSLTLTRATKNLIFYLQQNNLSYSARDLVTMDLGKGLQQYTVQLERR